MIFLVCRHNSKDDEIEVIPEKKTFSGLLGGPVWLTFHGLWWALTYYILAVLALILLHQTSLISSIVPFVLLIHLFIFLEGNQMRQAKLLSKKYEFVDLVDAADDLTALTKFLREKGRHPRG